MVKTHVLKVTREFTEKRPIPLKFNSHYENLFDFVPMMDLLMPVKSVVDHSNDPVNLVIQPTVFTK